MKLSEVSKIYDDLAKETGDNADIKLIISVLENEGEYIYDELHDYKPSEVTNIVTGVMVSRNKFIRDYLKNMEKDDEDRREVLFKQFLLLCVLGDLAILGLDFGNQTSIADNYEDFLSKVGEVIKGF